MATERDFQFLTAVMRLNELMRRNPEIMGKAHFFEDFRPLVSTIFLAAVSPFTPDLTDDEMIEAFEQAIENYMSYLEKLQNEKREKDDKKWHGPTTKSMN